MRIPGAVALVTGASSGMGAATAKALAAGGANVALLARTETDLEVVAAEIARAGGRSGAYPTDAADEHSVDLVVTQVREELGTPDVVVHCAGAGRFLFVEETPAGEAAQMVAAPYLAAFNVTRALLPAMLARRSGRIVTLNSAASRIVWPGATGYTAARWALRGFTEALRTDLRGTGIDVLAVVCGKVNTPYFEHNPGSEERIPKVRGVPALSPEDVARRIVRALERDSREIVIPRSLRVAFFTQALSPRLVAWQLWRAGHRHERA
jgi:uncharacterized protein